MGSKKTKTKQSNRPIYSGQIEGAANNATAAYNRQTGAINNFSDQLTDISSDMLARYRENAGQPTSAQGFLEGILANSGTANPYLGDIVDQTNSNLLDTIRTGMGTRGGLGGSDEMGILGDRLSRNELNLRYSDYDNRMNRGLQAASLTPSVDQAAYMPLDVAQQLGQMGALLPLQASALNSSNIGGLLGQYQDIEGEQTQKRGVFDWVGLGLQGASLFAPAGG